MAKFTERPLLKNLYYNKLILEESKKKIILPYKQ